MENITLGQISAVILFIVGFIGGVIALLTYVKKGLRGALKEDFDSIRSDIREIGISDCMNFLISCYAKIESGQTLDETEKQRYGDLYDKYTNEYHKNSYIHAKHEKLMREGKL